MSLGIRDTLEGRSTCSHTLWPPCCDLVKKKLLYFLLLHLSYRVKAVNLKLSLWKMHDTVDSFCSCKNAYYVSLGSFAIPRGIQNWSPIHTDFSQTRHPEVDSACLRHSSSTPLLPLSPVSNGQSSFQHTRALHKSLATFPVRSNSA